MGLSNNSAVGYGKNNMGTLVNPHTGLPIQSLETTLDIHIPMSAEERSTKTAAVFGYAPEQKQTKFDANSAFQNALLDQGYTQKTVDDILECNEEMNEQGWLARDVAIQYALRVKTVDDFDVGKFRDTMHYQSEYAELEAEYNPRALEEMMAAGNSKGEDITTLVHRYDEFQSRAMQLDDKYRIAADDSTNVDEKSPNRLRQVVNNGYRRIADSKVVEGIKEAAEKFANTKIGNGLVKTLKYGVITAATAGFLASIYTSTINPFNANAAETPKPDSEVRSGTGISSDISLSTLETEYKRQTVIKKEMFEGTGLEEVLISKQVDPDILAGADYAKLYQKGDECVAILRDNAKNHIATVSFDVKSFSVGLGGYLRHNMKIVLNGDDLNLLTPHLDFDLYRPEDIATVVVHTDMKKIVIYYEENDQIMYMASDPVVSGVFLDLYALETKEDTTPSVEKKVKQEVIPAMVFETPPKIDGKIEALWNTVYRFDEKRGAIDSVSLERHDDEKTIVYVGYDKDNLYIAMICYDKNIRHQYTKKKQTSSLGDDDYVSFEVVYDIDKVGDRKAWNTYLVNPKGAFKWDPAGGQVGKLEIAREPKTATTIHDGYWVVEIAAPWNSMRYPMSDEPLDIALGLYRGHDGDLAFFPETFALDEARTDTKLGYFKFQDWISPEWQPVTFVLPYVYFGVGEDGSEKETGMHIYDQRSSVTEILIAVNEDTKNSEEAVGTIDVKYSEELLDDSRFLFQFDEGGLGVPTSNFYSRRINKPFWLGGRFRTVLPGDIAASGLGTYGDDNNSVLRLQKDGEGYHSGLALISDYDTDNHVGWIDGTRTWPINKTLTAMIMADIARSNAGCKYWIGGFLWERTPNLYRRIMAQFIALEPNYVEDLGTHGTVGIYGPGFMGVKSRDWTTGEGDNALKHSLLFVPSLELKNYYNGDRHRRVADMYVRYIRGPHMFWLKPAGGYYDNSKDWRVWLGQDLNYENKESNFNTTLQIGRINGIDLKQISFGGAIPCENFQLSAGGSLQWYNGFKKQFIVRANQELTDKTGFGGSAIWTPDGINAFAVLHHKGVRGIEYHLIFGDQQATTITPRLVGKVVGAWSLDDVVHALTSFRLGQPRQ